MNQLTAILKQHTPMIHFQHNESGATLRASEVKPLLDKFILTKLGNGDIREGRLYAKKNNCIDFLSVIGSNERENSLLCEKWSYG